MEAAPVPKAPTQRSETVIIHTLDRWHQTKTGLAVFVVLELAIAYGFASLAIDQGHVWWYLLTIIFLIGSLQNVIRLIGKAVYGNKAAKA
jgi:hypothetical protein